MEPIEPIIEERRTAVVGATATVRLYVIAVVVMAMTTIAAVVAVAVFMPAAQSANVITAIIGVTAPIILALLAGGQHSMSVAMDGKLSQIVRATAERERARGVIEGLKDNPNNID